MRQSVCTWQRVWACGGVAVCMHSNRCDHDGPQARAAANEPQLDDLVTALRSGEVFTSNSGCVHSPSGCPPLCGCLSVWQVCGTRCGVSEVPGPMYLRYSDLVRICG